MIYLDLLIGFLEVGLFSFGGAYSAIPLIRDVVLSYGWLTDEELAYMIAVSESTPGPIMINLATYVGSSQAGIIGAAIATAAVALPVFCIILILMAALNKVLKNKYVQAALDGLIPCIIGIILATGIFMIISRIGLMTNKFVIDLKTVILTVVLSVLMFGSNSIFKKQMSPIVLILIAAGCRIVVL